MKDVYATRRMFVLWLPFTVLGMAVMLYSYTLTPTANGLTFVGLFTAGLGVLAAALDTEDES